MQWLRYLAVSGIITGVVSQETVVDFDDIEINTDKTYIASIPKTYQGFKFDRLIAIDCEAAADKGKIPEKNRFSCASPPNAAYGYQNINTDKYPTFNSTNGKFTLNSISISPQFDIADAEVEVTIIGFTSEDLGEALSFNKVIQPDETDWVFEPDADADEQWVGLTAIRVWGVDNEESNPTKLFVDDM
jgi:hypothetical protein